MERLTKHVPLRGSRPIFLEVRSSTGFIVTACCIAVFTDIFLYGVVVPVIPFALRERVNIPAEHVQRWVSILLAVYSAGLLVSAPICGFIADRIESRRVTLLVGMCILIGATAMLCVGRSIGVLLAGRIVQGISAGLVWTVALALLSDTAGKQGSGRTLGYVATSYSMGVLVAPFLGGVVYEKSGYYAVFAMTFGVLILDVILRFLIVEKKVAAKWIPESQPRLEPVVAVDEEAGGKLQEIKEVTQIETDARNNDHEKNAAIATVTALVTAPKRNLPPILILLKSRRILAAFWGSLVAATAMAAFDTTLPLYVNKIFGWDSLGAGLIFIALIIPSFAGPVIGHYTDKYGPRWIATGGLLAAVPSWVLLRLVDHSGTRQIVLLVVLLVFIGITIALIITSLMTEFAKVCDEKERQNPGLFGNRSAYAQSYSIFNIAWAAGSLIGPLWAAGVEAQGGWKMMTWTLGLLNGVSALPVLLYCGGSIFRSMRG